MTDRGWYEYESYYMTFLITETFKCLNINHGGFTGWNDRNGWYWNCASFGHRVELGTVSGPGTVGTVFSDVFSSWRFLFSIRYK